MNSAEFKFTDKMYVYKTTFASIISAWKIFDGIKYKYKNVTYHYNQHALLLLLFKFDLIWIIVPNVHS